MFMDFVECNFQLLERVAVERVLCRMILGTVFCGYCFPIIYLNFNFPNIYFIIILWNNIS